MNRTRVPLRRWLGRALLVAAAFVVVVIASHPLWLAPWISQRLSASARRPVHFDSIWIGLSSRFMPVVHCRGVRIANAGWAQTARPLAALAEVVAVMSWRSFSERRPVVELMTLREGEVDLELQADGLRNWRLMRPEDRGPGRFKILSLTAERTNLRFVHGGLDLQLEATTSAATIEAGAAPGPTPPIRVVLDGAWRGLPFAADLGVEPPLTFIETGRQARLRGWIRSGGAQLDVDGRAGDLLRQPRIDAHVAFAGASLAPFHAFIGRRGAAPRAFRGEGELQVSADGYALKDMRARIGRSDMAGELAFSSAADRGMVRASLASDLLDLDDLLWLAREGGVAPRPSTDALGNVATEVPDFGALRRNDAELRIHARRFHAAAYPLLQSLGLQATLNGGRLALAGIDIGLGKGHVIGRAAVDWRSQPPAAEAELRWAGLHLQALWPDQPEDHRVTGALQGTVAITAAGASGTALLQSASGTLSASLVGGTIAGRLDAEMGLQGGRMLSSLFGGGSERVAIRCAHAVLDVGGGRGRLRRFVVESELTRTTAVGSIGLVDQTLDVVLTPEARKGGLFVLERSIRLHGPMRKPEHTLIDRRAAAPGSGCAA